MMEIKDSERELQQFRLRLTVLGVVALPALSVATRVKLWVPCARPVAV